jgi:hypothetical protein
MNEKVRGIFERGGVCTFATKTSKGKSCEKAQIRTR